MGWPRRAALGAVSLLALNVGAHADRLVPPTLVAHAGGAVGEHTYTNSREALVAAAEHGFHLIELDFSFTRDGHLVLLHDWGKTPEQIFEGALPDGPMSLAEFRAAGSRLGLTHMSLDDLGAWLETHPEIDIVTDFKTDSIRGLEHIVATLPRLQARFVPQIYALDEHEQIADLGFDRIIFTLYVTRGATSNEEVLRYAAEHRPFAVTMPVYRTRSGLSRELAAAGVFVYTHTINDRDEIEELSARGVSGFYTDWLQPAPPVEPAGDVSPARPETESTTREPAQDDVGDGIGGGLRRR